MITRKTTDDMGANSNAMLGLSGLDTASMLKSMMAPYKRQISSLSQKQQVVVWKQERYRDLISKLNDFKAKFFDYRNYATNISSPGTWKKFLVENPGSEYVKISSTPDSKPVNGKIEMVKMPKPSEITGRSGLVRDVEGVMAPSWITAIGSYLTINMDGIERSIQITAAMATQPTDEDKVEMLQNAIDAAFGPGMLTVNLVLNSSSVNVLRFTANPAEVNQFTIKDGGASTARIELGFGGNANLSNKIVPSDTLSILSSRMNVPINFVPKSTFDSNGLPVIRDVVEFSINNVKFQFSKFDSLRTVMDTVNYSGCGATMKYDNVNDRFSLVSSISGPGENIRLKEEETNFFAAIGLGFLDEDNVVPAVNIVGGQISLSLVNDINASNSLITPVPYIFDITVNGITKKIALTRNNYLDNDDLFADLNAKLGVAFPAAGLTFAAQPTSIPGIEDIVMNIDKTAANAAWSVQIAADPATPPGAMIDFGFDDLQVKLAAASPAYTPGEFGRVIIDGVVLQVDRPVFEYNGVLYELRKLPPPGSDPIEYTLRTDTDKIVALIREFVEAYNELARLIGAALSEKRDKDYLPLTDEQKEKMTEKEIEKWEAKAKTGILRGDTGFFSLSSKLRMAVSNPVYLKYGDKAALQYNLKKMGIDTKDQLSGMFNPADNGALFIDEQALRYAIETDLDQIALLFTKPPEVYKTKPEDADKPAAWHAKMKRQYSDYTGGLATKITNVLDDYIRTMRGSNNAKGVLIERAGVERDSSELYNAFSREIFEYERRINSLWDRYDKIEKQKIRVLSRLESVISNASVQMDWMQGQMGQQK